jgi:hypothetical protein
MRIHFNNLGHAKLYLKAGKRLLDENLISPEGGRLPTQRLRNAFCKGWGYSSYNELELIMRAPREYDNSLLTPDDLRWAFYKGFSLALIIAEEYEFRLPEPPAKLAVRLTEEVLCDWRV